MIRRGNNTGGMLTHDALLIHTCTAPEDSRCGATSTEVVAGGGPVNFSDPFGLCYPPSSPAVCIRLLKALMMGVAASSTKGACLPSQKPGR